MPNSTWDLAVERASAYAGGVKATSNAIMTRARKTMGCSIHYSYPLAPPQAVSSIFFAIGGVGHSMLEQWTYQTPDP
jgi:hypothetical protein